MVRGDSLLGLMAWLGLWATGTQAQARREKDLVRQPEGNNLLWEIGKYYTAEMCEIYMETKDGGNCQAQVTCKKGGTIKCPYFPNINGAANCFPGGRTTCNDPRIGEFTIIWTKKDGTEGQGLTDPVIEIKNMPNKLINVSPLAHEHYDAEWCSGTPHRTNCDPGPFVCRWLLQPTTGFLYYDNVRLKRWSCGVPRDGKTWPKGMSWDKLAPGSGWEPAKGFQGPGKTPWLGIYQPGRCEKDIYCKHWRDNNGKSKVPTPNYPTAAPQP